MKKKIKKKKKLILYFYSIITCNLKKNCLLPCMHLYFVQDNGQLCCNKINERKPKKKKKKETKEHCTYHGCSTIIYKR